MPLPNVIAPKSKIKSDYSFFGFMFVRLIFGIYFKLSSSKIICVLAKLYCIFISFQNILYYIVLYNRSFYKARISAYINALHMVTEMATNTVMSLYTEEEYVTRFSAELKDSTNLPTTINHLPYILILMTIPVHIASYAQTFKHQKSILDNLLFTFLFMSCYTGHLTTVYVMDMYRKSVHFMKKNLTDKFKDKELNDDEKYACIKTFLDGRIKVMEILIQTMKLRRWKMVFGFADGFLRILVLLFDIIASDISGNHKVAWILQVCLYTAVVCAPLILTEMVANDLDETQAFLARELLLYKDMKLRIILHDALLLGDFANKHSMWNGFPINMDTLLGFLNLCVSYIIAMLQFSY